MAALARRATIASHERERGGSMLEWKVRVLTLLVAFVTAADEFVSGYNWNW
jgi:hypothetical protein